MKTQQPATATQVFDCKVTKLTPGGQWDVNGRNAHLLFGSNMNASVMWYDCVSNTGVSRINNLCDEKVEQGKTTDDAIANVLSFTDKEDNRTRHYLFKEASELESVLALIQNKDPDEQQDSGKAGDGNA